jgi:hypothetical protein
MFFGPAGTGGGARLSTTLSGFWHLLQYPKGLGFSAPQDGQFTGGMLYHTRPARGQMNR